MAVFLSENSLTCLISTESRQIHMMLFTHATLDTQLNSFQPLSAFFILSRCFIHMRKCLQLLTHVSWGFFLLPFIFLFFFYPQNSCATHVAVFWLFFIWILRTLRMRKRGKSFLDIWREFCVRNLWMKWI